MEGTQMFDPETIGWLASAGVVAPFLISFLKSETWSTQTKRYFAVAVSIPLGVGVMIATGGWDTFAITDVDGILAAATEVWLLGQVAFAFVIKGTKLEDRASETGAGLRVKSTNTDEV